MKKMKIIRKKSLRHFGFGIDAMMRFTVCPECKSLEASHKLFCSKCKKRLPRTNLYDVYRACHKTCMKCGVVLSADMRFCPHCGIKIKNDAEPCAL